MENGNVKFKQSAQECITSITLPFDPLEFPRETPRHYICATEEELKEMLSEIGLGDLSQLFVHIDPNILFPHPLPLSEEKDYHEVAKKISEISKLSNHKISFIGDQLPVWKTPSIVEFVSKSFSIYSIFNFSILMTLP